MLKMKSLEAFESVSHFEYDAMGRRLIYTDDDGNKTLYYYFSNQETKTVYSLQDGAIGFIISSRDAATGNDTWYHYDQLGTVMNLTDDVGAVTASYDQDAFGNVLSGSASGFHLTTKDYNSPIGLYYFYHRWYDTSSGRFTTRSKLLPYEEHPYGFCVNNPVGYMDPSGRSPISEPEYSPLEVIIHYLNLNGKERECILRMRKQSVDISNTWGGKYNDKNGFKFLHCVFMCKAHRSCGISKDRLRFHGNLHEIFGGYSFPPEKSIAIKRGHSVYDDSIGDLGANELGLNCPQNEGCIPYCLSTASRMKVDGSF